MREGRLLIRGLREQEALAGQLLARKAELLPLLVGPAAWDQAEADRLLAELRADVERISAGFPGRAPAARMVLKQQALVVRWKVDGQDRCVVEKKEELKGRIGRGPAGPFRAREEVVRSRDLGPDVSACRRKRSSVTFGAMALEPVIACRI